MSASDEIAGLTGGELTAHYKAGALTPLEATLAIFARIEQLSILFITLSSLYENASNHDPIRLLCMPLINQVKRLAGMGS